MNPASALRIGCQGKPHFALEDVGYMSLSSESPASAILFAPHFCYKSSIHTERIGKSPARIDRQAGAL
jgi:hypothetical protein